MDFRNLLIWLSYCKDTLLNDSEYFDVLRYVPLKTITLRLYDTSWRQIFTTKYNVRAQVVWRDNAWQILKCALAWAWALLSTFFGYKKQRISCCAVKIKIQGVGEEEREKEGNCINGKNCCIIIYERQKEIAPTCKWNALMTRRIVNEIDKHNTNCKLN